jgi:histidinol dehydrogenase
MRTVRHTNRDYADQIRAMIAASSLFDPIIEKRAREIITQVHQKGDEALLDLTARFDGVKLRLEQLRLSPAELVAASIKAETPLRQAIDEAIRNIATFSRKSLRKSWSGRNRHGAKVGEKYDAFRRIGIYIPGGTAPLVSTALMTVVLARVAGCQNIVVCTPCNRAGEVNPALLLALCQAGATEIYRLGGAQAIAAMALGTPSICRVQKVFGPGNAYVVAAKRLLFGHVAIDLLPGPSEVLVLADDSAKAKFVAADMLAQAEHGSGHERIWLVTTSGRLIQSVQREIERQLISLTRRRFVDRVLSHHTWLIQVRNLDEGIRLTNQIAPEHCEIMVHQPARLAAQILTAGAIFLGPYSPTVLGDYIAGPSHELPTGGAGTSFSGLTADQFQRRTSLVEYTLPGLRKAHAVLQQFAAIEGLAAHARSASIRLEKP